MKPNYTLADMKDSIRYWEIRIQNEPEFFIEKLGEAKFNFAKQNLETIKQITKRLEDSKNVHPRDSRLIAATAILKSNTKMLQTAGIID